MLDWISITLILTAIVIDIIALFVIHGILRRLKGKVRGSIILLFVAISFLFVRTILNFFDLSSIISIQLLDNIFAIVIGMILLFSVIHFLSSVRAITDSEIENYRKEEHLPPPKSAQKVQINKVFKKLS
jgi:hypothetical protein